MLKREKNFNFFILYVIKCDIEIKNKRLRLVEVWNSKSGENMFGMLN